MAWGYEKGVWLKLMKQNSGCQGDQRGHMLDHRTDFIRQILLANNLNLGDFYVFKIRVT